MTARVTIARPARGTRVPTAPALLLATALGFAAASAHADTPTPAAVPAPITLTTPPPPVLTSAGPARAAAASAPARTSLPDAPSAASALGLGTSKLPEPATPAAPATGAAGSDPRSPEPKVEHLVTEDSAVRIEEDRVRSQTTRIVVKSKVLGSSYEVVPQDLSKDPATDSKAGKRVWLNIGF